MEQESDSPQDDNGHQFDLPVMSNVSEVLVEHFTLDLSSDIVSQTFLGCATYFIQPVKFPKTVRVTGSGTTFQENESGIGTVSDPETSSPHSDINSVIVDGGKDGVQCSNNGRGGAFYFYNASETAQSCQHKTEDIVSSELVPGSTSHGCDGEVVRKTHVGESGYITPETTCSDRPTCSSEKSLHVSDTHVQWAPVCSATLNINAPGQFSGDKSDTPMAQGGVFPSCSDLTEGLKVTGDKNLSLSAGKPNPDADKPNPDEDQSNFHADKPNPDAHKSNPDAHKSNPDADKPNPDAHKSNPDADKPNPDAHKSNPDADKPNPDAHKSNPDTDKPNPDVDKSNLDADKPIPDAYKLKTYTDKPNPDADKINPSTVKSNLNADKPNTSTHKPKPYADQPAPSEPECKLTRHTGDAFQLILDCCDNDIISAEEVVFLRSVTECGESCSSWEDRHSVYKQVRQHTTSPLSFSVEKWCVKIMKAGVTSAEDFPRCVRVRYRTRPGGASLKWSLDQDGKLSVFTHGHWINNRSLFPGQDSPVTMATWQASIHVPGHYVVLMSGDQTATCVSEPHGYTCYNYYTDMKMPASTLALAIGQWSQVTLCEPVLSKGQSIRSPCDHHPDGSCHVNFSSAPILPCRLFAPTSLLERAASEIKDYIPRCFGAAHKLLGNHPFCRLDILVVPKGFASLALACPCLMFISQTLLPGDQSVCIRLAHELSHSWFGLLIGALDWTEEWLTEGFATYLEDCIHGNAMEWDESYQRQYGELRAIIRHRNLSAEMSTTQEQLQVLRPSKSPSQSEDGSTQYIKHGMNPDKTFTQVHYLKGYFLLRHLSQLVGVDNFNACVKLFVDRFHGQLITSQNVFDHLFEIFPELTETGLSCEVLYKDWLDFPGMPQSISTLTVSPDNLLVSRVQQEFDRWKPMCKLQRKRSSAAKKRRKLSPGPLLPVLPVKLIPDQLVLVLELLLEENHCPVSVLTALSQTYSISAANADVRHRWCELVIKFRCARYYDQVKDFLINDQAMGVYLFGELLISRDKQQRELAESCFQQIAHDMEEGPYKTVHTMLYGETIS